MQVVSALDKTAPEPFLKGVSTRHFHLQLAEHFARSTISSGFGPCFWAWTQTLVDCCSCRPRCPHPRWSQPWMAALRLWVRQIVFPRAQDATSSPAFPQSIRDEDVNAQTNCHRALGNLPLRCCMAVHVDALYVPHLPEVRTFSVRQLVGRPSCCRISRWSAEASSSPIERDMFAFRSAKGL